MPRSILDQPQHRSFLRQCCFHNKWQTFMFEVCFKIPLHKNKYLHHISTCFIDFTSNLLPKQIHRCSESFRRLPEGRCYITLIQFVVLRAKPNKLYGHSVGKIFFNNTRLRTSKFPAIWYDSDVTEIIFHFQVSSPDIENSTSD